mmetsp:Transcript_58898/g.138043  ORF Transcript_58898/g.138043 Transcript_58898/m.138043 type:complete len:186 (+) Transcript_58898:23-580(+)
MRLPVFRKWRWQSVHERSNRWVACAENGCWSPHVFSCYSAHWVQVASLQGLSNMAKHVSVNIPEMDKQHQELYSAVFALKESSSCVEDLGHIITAVEAHFKAEEDLFEQYKIPNVVTHRSEHKRFLATLREKHAELSTKCETKGDVSKELEQLVKSSVKWLNIHTNAYDAPQYGTFFKDGEYIGN